MNVIADVKKYAPTVAVVLVGVSASELVTASRGTIARVAGALAGGIAALIIGHKLGAL